MYLNTVKSSSHCDGVRCADMVAISGSTLVEGLATGTKYKSNGKIFHMAADTIDGHMPNGRTASQQDKILLEWAYKFNDGSDTIYSIVGHGMSQLLAGKSAVVWAEKLSKKMPKKTELVLLLSCNVAKGENSFAQQLSAELKRRGRNVVVRGFAAYVQGAYKPAFGPTGMRKPWADQATYFFSSDSEGKHKIPYRKAVREFR